MCNAPNPFWHEGTAGGRDPGWYYSDEAYNWAGPFRSERMATRALLDYCYYLEYGPTRWQRVCSALKAFWRDETSGGAIRHLWSTRHDTGGQGQG